MTLLTTNLPGVEAAWLSGLRDPLFLVIPRGANWRWRDRPLAIHLRGEKGFAANQWRDVIIASSANATDHANANFPKTDRGDAIPPCQPDGHQEEPKILFRYKVNLSAVELPCR
jgi:hypothetical protein